MTKLSLNDSSFGMVIKMSEGNPGAVQAITELLTSTPHIDPQCATPELNLLLLDEMQIYGSAIYVLWNDKCGRDTRSFIVLLRAVQLGIIPQGKIQALAYDQERKVNLEPAEFNDIDAKVCQQLDQFQRP